MMSSRISPLLAARAQPLSARMAPRSRGFRGIDNGRQAPFVGKAAECQPRDFPADKLLNGMDAAGLIRRSQH